MRDNSRETVRRRPALVLCAAPVAVGDIVVLDTRALKEVRRVHAEGSSPTGLALDPHLSRS
ncbi:hypothetical protein [Streptomyces sp. NPDC058240]|uniref:hypothetical protein n=1 Tax=Streptomyces sp. NPDC058240 TaxID=3346396 RepID=UPI0036E67C50